MSRYQARVALDILLHRSGHRMRLTRWPGGWLATLQVGNKRAVLDRFSAQRLRDALTDFIDDPPSGDAIEASIAEERNRR